MKIAAVFACLCCALCMTACGASDSKLELTGPDFSQCTGEMVVDNEPTGSLRNIALSNEKGMAVGLLEQVKYMNPIGVAGQFNLVDTIYYSGAANNKLIDGDENTWVSLADDFFFAEDEYKQLHFEETEGIAQNSQLYVQITNPIDARRIVLRGNMNWRGVLDLRIPHGYQNSKKSFSLMRIFKNRPVSKVEFKRPKNKKYSGYFIERYSLSNPCSQADGQEGPQKMSLYSSVDRLREGYNGGGIVIGHHKDPYSCHKGEAEERGIYKVELCNEGNGDVWCENFKVFGEHGEELNPLKRQINVSRIECTLNQALPRDSGLVFINSRLLNKIPIVSTDHGQFVGQKPLYISEFELYGK